MNLDQDLQRILQVGAKIYCRSQSKQGRVTRVGQASIEVNFGTSKIPDSKTYDLEDFKSKLISDEIVSASRLALGQTDKFVIKPREVQPQSEVKAEVKAEPSAQTKLSEVKSDFEVAYVDFDKGFFSKSQKPGLTKIEYRTVKTSVHLELTSDQIDKLNELGLL